MTDAERERAFLRERARQRRRLVQLHRETAREVQTLLRRARDRIKAELAGDPSAFAAWQLPQIQKSVDQAMRDLGEALAQRSSAAAGAAHQLGLDLVDRPLEAAGIRLAAVLPEVDLRQLVAIRSFLTDRLRDVPAEIGRKVKGQIALAMMGAQPPNAAIGAISSLIEGGRGRALTIVRTEMGRAFSVAAQERKQQAAELLPGLRKQWRRSGKIHSRVSHDLADGQIKPVDEPFVVGGTKLMYPRDPKAPAKHTVNCGCVSLPFMESWEVRQAGRQPFSDDELAAAPQKRTLRDLDPDPRGAAAAPPAAVMERLSPPAARRQVADDLASADFRAFLQGAAASDQDHFTVGVLPDDLATILGAEARAVRLSAATAAKQRRHRQGQDFSARDYARVQGLLEEGLALREGGRHLVLFSRGGGDVWRAVVKVTSDGKEMYLATLHRSNERQRQRAVRRLRVVR